MVPKKVSVGLMLLSQCCMLLFLRTDLVLRVKGTFQDYSGEISLIIKKEGKKSRMEDQKKTGEKEGKRKKRKS